MANKTIKQTVLGSIAQTVASVFVGSMTTAAILVPAMSNTTISVVEQEPTNNSYKFEFINDEAQQQLKDMVSDNPQATHFTIQGVGGYNRVYLYDMSGDYISTNIQNTGASQKEASYDIYHYLESVKINYKLH